MRLVVIALALPAMFIAMGLAALFIPYCGLPSSMVAAYLVLLPLVRYAKDYLYLRLRYFGAALLAFGAVWALEAALEPLLRDYRSSLDFLIQAMSTCPQWRSYLFVTAVILAPVVEEVLFRVLLYTELEKRAGPLVGYVGNSLAFALLHGLPTLLPLYFIYGVILTYAFRRGGIISAIVLHGVNNFLVFTTL
ncbi:MAG: CPBP family intramembrane metalloprotease [Pyrobaculum sp.]|nr:CPBP family intramembrane metalloprotease [Pyrobaculum sp.]